MRLHTPVVPNTPADHRDAVARHELAAENHERAARFWDDRGDQVRAKLQRDLAEHERHGGQLERQWAELMDAEAHDVPEPSSGSAGRAEIAVSQLREGAKRLSSILIQTANTLERSAALAEEHARRRQEAGEPADAEKERRAAEHMRAFAERVRSQSQEWLKTSGKQ